MASINPVIVPMCEFRRRSDRSVKAIGEDAKNALELGLTYGQYKAQQYMGCTRIIRKW